MLEISFNGSDKRTVEALLSKTDSVISRLALKLNALMIRLQAKIVGEKLKGQVLHRRSGKLIQSIRIIEPTIEGGNLRAGVQGAGGPVFYGRLHEFGYTYSRQAGHRRIAFNAKGDIVKLLTRAKHERRSVRSTKSIEVRSYTVTIPERSFMRTSQEEMRPVITEELKQTASDAIKE
jgi:hypothetical protein